MSKLIKPLAPLSLGLFLLRLLLGVVFFAHGAQKVLGWFGGYGMAATAEFFTKSLGLPALLAYVSALTEFLGGISMVFGLGTRIFALGLAINMAVAILVVHLHNGLFSPGGFELPLSLFTIALSIFLLGPGSYSLDQKLLSAHNSPREHTSGRSGAA